MSRNRKRAIEQNTVVHFFRFLLSRTALGVAGAEQLVGKNEPAQTVEAELSQRQR
jgi:hypothetical protein